MQSSLRVTPARRSASLTQRTGTAGLLALLACTLPLPTHNHLCRCWLALVSVSISTDPQMHIAAGLGKVLFTSDNVYVASMVTKMEDDTLCHVLLIFSMGFLLGLEEASHRAVADWTIDDFIWLPGSHTVLLQGEGCLARLDLDGVPPDAALKLEWLATELYGAQHVCMALVPGADAVLLLSCKQGQAEFALHETGSLDCLEFWERKLPSNVRGTRPDVLSAVQSKPSLHVSCRTAALCCGSTFEVGSTCVWAFDRDELGGLLWSDSGLSSLDLSLCGLFACACRGSKHVVLDALTGACLLEVPVCSVLQLQGSVIALRTAWAGSGHGQLHACSVHFGVEVDSEASGSEAGGSEGGSEAECELSMAFQVVRF